MKESGTSHSGSGYLEENNKLENINMIKTYRREGFDSEKNRNSGNQIIIFFILSRMKALLSHKARNMYKKRSFNRIKSQRIYKYNCIL